MIFSALADAVLVVHFGYLAYVVLGGFAAWWRPRALWPHLAAVTWGVLVVGASLRCPLTSLENWLRQRAGQPVSGSGFIDRYVEGVLYPARYTAELRWLAAAVVVSSWIGVFWHNRGAGSARGHRVS